MQRPTFTVITSTFQCAGPLPACLASVAAQRGVAVEHLVVDGGSRDGTADIIAKSAALDGSPVSWWCSERDEGIYDAWNKALSHANGAWVLFLGADDVFAADDVLARLDEVCAAVPEDVPFVYGRVRRVGFADGGHVSWGQPWDQASEAFLGWGVFGSSIPHQGVAQRRATFDVVGPFDATLATAADADMVARLLAGPTPPRFVDLVVADMAVGGASGDPRRVVRTWREDLLLFDRHGIPRNRARRLLKKLKWWIKIGLFSLPLLRPLVYHVADLGRRLQGKHAYWTRLRRDS